jgi:hypothetical protein
VDAFEDLVARVFRGEGFWTRQNYRVSLTKQDKVALGKPSLPRPEVDVLAYQPVENKIIWEECKSYLDSSGVHIDAFNGRNPVFAKRLELFTDAPLRELVTQRLMEQLETERLTRPRATIEYWLVAGRLASVCADELRGFFDEPRNPKWVLKDRTWLISHLQALVEMGYDDDVVSMVPRARTGRASASGAPPTG